MNTYHWDVLVRYHWDLVECFIWEFFETSETHWWDVLITSSWDVVTTFQYDVGETCHWGILATFHRDIVGCFIWVVPATSLRRTERPRHYDVVTTSPRTSCYWLGCFFVILLNEKDIKKYLLIESSTEGKNT